MKCKHPAPLGAAVSLVILLSIGAAAVAEPITGTAGDDVLLGTPRRDTIRGLAGNDDITGRHGNDRVFGDQGADTFHWSKGDGQDRIDGGANSDFLSVSLGMRLRLHIDLLGGGPLTTAGTDLEVIAVKALEGIGIIGTSGANRLVLSSDERVVQGAIGIIEAGDGNDRVDLSALRVDTDTFPGRGDDMLRLGKGRDVVNYSASNGHDTIFNFGAEDVILLLDPNAFRTLDTNEDGRIDRHDTTVKVRNGTMTVDLAPVLDEPPGPTSITFVGRAALSLDNFSFQAG